jgi:hypothetical protein
MKNFSSQPKINKHKVVLIISIHLLSNHILSLIIYDGNYSNVFESVCDMYPLIFMMFDYLYNKIFSRLYRHKIN